MFTRQCCTFLATSLLLTGGLATKLRAQLPPPLAPYVDLKCYGIETPPLQQPIRLQVQHLNPLLSDKSPEFVAIVQPIQLCVPVAKAGVEIPPDVADFH